MDGRIQMTTTHAVVLTLLISVMGCSKTSDETAIRAVVAKAVEAAESKDVGGFMKLISKAYKDDSGNDYNAVKGIILYQFFRSDNVMVFVRSLEVEIKGDTAVVNAKVALSRGADIKGLKDIPPDAASAMTFSVVLKKEDGRWKAVNARWERTGVSGLI
ncbi:MAG: hypothetical protein HY886_05920 [Deltaproteobacteria bacterium]|nr:hypothetical protein [Deltaproteobacteria bacterium]